MRQAFTLLELMIVFAVLAILGGLSAVIGPVILARSKVQTTQATVDAIAVAVTAEGSVMRSIEIPGLQAARDIPAWDVNEDGWLDGDPQADAVHPDPTRATELEWSISDRSGILNILPTYRGTVAGLSALTLPDSRLDLGRRPLDGWKRPLRTRLLVGDQSPDGRRGLGIYSMGPDGIDQNGDGDDMRSW